MRTLAILTIVASLAAEQAAPANFAAAEQLARAGRTVEALQQFEAIVRQHPDDVEARLWYARLLRRTGQSRFAEREFRRAHEQAPDHPDALTGLAGVLDSRGAYDEAADLLERAEAIAPQSGDVLAARARHLRFTGRSSASETYYERARTQSPKDPDIRMGLEQIRRVNRHRVEANVYTESASASPHARSADLALDLRTTDRLRFHARMQAHARFEQHEVRAGGGLEWRVRPAVTLRASSLIGPGADIIARFDSAGEIEHVRGRMESVFAIRHMSFATAGVWIVAPGGTFWIDDRAAISLRYYGSSTRFDGRPAVVNHSGGVRLRVNVHPRVWLDGAYARGYESFEQLSADRLGQFRADTFSAGILYHLPALQSLATTFEYQRRSDHRRMIRVTAGVVHRF